MKLVNSELYVPFRERVAEFAEQQTMVHAPLNIQPASKVLDAKVTEFIRIVSNPGATSQKQLIADLDKLAEILASRKGCSGAASAQTVENAKEHVLFSGWESLEVIKIVTHPNSSLFPHLGTSRRCLGRRDQ